MTLIILAWQKAQSYPELCFSDVMEEASCDMTLRKVLHKQILSIIYKVMRTCDFITRSFLEDARTSKFDYFKFCFR